MKLLLLLIYLLTSFCIFSQSDWRTLMNSPDATFQETQDAFYAEFGDSINPKGSGWKQFKRWEYFHGKRLDENGNMQTADQLWQAVQQHEQMKLSKSYSAGSGNWEEVGPIRVPQAIYGETGMGRVSTIAFHPTDNQTIYTGASSGGFWKSTDKGKTWQKSVNGLTRLGVNSIVINPNNPDVILIATGDRDGNKVRGFGVWKSTDGGATWNPSNSGMGNINAYEILMHPTHPDTLIVSGNNRIYRSTNGGANWAAVNIGTNARDIAFHPTHPDTIYAASNNKVLRSTDGGLSFAPIMSGLPASGVHRFALAVSADEPDWLYVLAANGPGLVGIYRSTDSGNTFLTRTTTPNILGFSPTGSDNRSQSGYDLVIEADPNNANKIFTGGINIWKSVDGGATMTVSSHRFGGAVVSGNAIPYVHADQHYLIFSPYTGEIFSGNDGGVNYSTDDGVTWIELYNKLSIGQIYKISVSQTVPELAIAGFQDNGTSMTLEKNWKNTTDGDGMECIIDPLDENYIYTSLPAGKINQSTNGGRSFSGITSTISGESGAFVTPYKLSPNSDTMYLGYSNIWRNGFVRILEDWTKISNFSVPQKIKDIAIAKSNSSVMYVSRNKNNERLFKSTNVTSAAPTWANLTANLPINRTPEDIEIDPTDENHLFIALLRKVYESTDGGSTWTDYSTGLPNLFVNTLVIDRESPVKAMYLGMDVGVYYRDNTMSSWVLYDNGIPNVEITELEIHQNQAECKSKIYAGTYGRGLWMSDLKSVGSNAPRACFEIKQTDICSGASTKLIDLSDFDPTSWTWSITPNTFTFINSTDANSQNPEVTFNQSGNYNITLTATNTNGSNVKSETKTINIQSVTNASTFNENFESYNTCGTVNNCGSTTCPIIGKWNNLTNGTQDAIDWRIDNGGTFSPDTGPSADYSEGTSTGKYAYLEASSCSNKAAILESSCMYLDGYYTFNLGYHMYGDQMGSLYVDIFSDEKWTEGIAYISGNQGNQWKILPVSLGDYAGKYVKIRVRGVTGSNFPRSDIAIDSMSFKLNAALPAELISFDAKLQNNEKTLLNWSTASERNVDYFEVQKSLDANNWQKLTKVNAAGNSIEKLDYKTTDDNPSVGINYYRLKIIDLDGEYEYSPIRSVFKLAPNNKISIYPNPANSSIQVINQDIDEKRVLVKNSLGQHILVHTNPISSNQISVEIEHLTNGIYYLVIVSSDGEKITKKFVKK